MYNKTKYDMPFCGLSLKLYPTGKKSPSYEYSAVASKQKFICSLTKRKYSLSQVTEWFNTPQVQKYHNAGYELKYMSKEQTANNPSKYATSDQEQIFCIVMVKPYKPRTIDGMKPISESVPKYTEQPMTQARPSAPDHASTAELSDLDDDLPPF